MKATFSSYIGRYFLAAGLMLNEFLLGYFLAPKGEIASPWIRGGILAQQLLLVSVGLWLIYRFSSADDSEE